MNATGAALLLTVGRSLAESFPNRAGGLGLFDRLGGRDFFGDRFLWLDPKRLLGLLADIFDDQAEPLHG